MAKEEISMYEFLEAALPWIAMGVFVAVACAFMGQKEK